MTTRSSILSTEERDSLIRAVLKAKQGSYSPYSKFPVGAALLTADGTIIMGANVDNASWGATTCAERTAIVKAVSEGIRSFVALAIVADVPSPIPPCGLCRQVIREFCALDMPVLLVPGDYPKAFELGDAKPGVTEGGVRETTVGELLPDSSGPENLDPLGKWVGVKHD